jgi:hypothetical protein
MDISNEQKAREIAERYQTPCHGHGDCEFESYQSAFEAMQWKDEQREKEKQQWIDKAWNWLTEQKGERTKEDFIKAMKGE